MIEQLRCWTRRCVAVPLDVAAVVAAAATITLAGSLSTIAAPSPAAPAAAPRPDQFAFREIFRELVETDTSHSIGNCTAAAEKMAVHLRGAGFPESDIMSTIVGGETGASMKALVSDPTDVKAAAALSQDPRLNAMLRTTCVATLMDAGHASNALPQRARANINCRIFPGVAVEAVRQTLIAIVADSQISVTTVEPSDPTVRPPPLTAEIMKPIEQVTRKIYPGIEVVPVLQAAGTDAIYTAEARIPTYGVSGMFVDPDLGNIHGLNERIRVQSLYDGRDFLYALVKLYAAQSR